MGTRLRIDGSVLTRLLVSGALCLCASGCFLFGGGRPKASLVSNDPGQKIPAIKKANDVNQSETAKQLVKSLSSEDPAVRFYSIRGLQNLTGETFGYVWYADESDRRPAADKWKKWLDDGQAGSLAGGDPNAK